MLELQDQFPVSLVGLNPNELVTFRWRHAEANWTPNSLKPGKAMVDVSKATMAELGRVITVHCPVAKLCPPWSYTTKALRTGMTRGMAPLISRGMAPLIIVHHYSGTREQRAARFTWGHQSKAHRSDLRLRNGVQMWLRGFVTSVGPQEALHLLSPHTTSSSINPESPYGEPVDY